MPADKVVLIVDDDPDLHELLKTALREENLRIESAHGGAEALEKIRDGAYDLVLLDIMTPDVDGLNVLHRLHAIRPALKVVIMTAENTSSNLMAAIREQAFSYFSKPFAIPAVVDSVLRALEAEMGEDDIQVVSSRPQWVSLNVRCRLETADRIAQFFREMDMGLSADEQEQAVTAFRELLMNAIEHGCHTDPSMRVNLTYIRTSRAVIYVIRDPGQGFSLENVPHAAISNPPDEPLEHTEIRKNLGIRPGGFGILLTRNLVDDVIYSEKGNEVLLIKFLENQSAARA